MTIDKKIDLDRVEYGNCRGGNEINHSFLTSSNVANGSLSRKEMDAYFDMRLGIMELNKNLQLGGKYKYIDGSGYKDGYWNTYHRE